MRENRKDTICKVALQLFAENGYHSTSISKIAKEAGISKGLLYNYFESKEDLLSSIIGNMIDNIMDMLNPNHDDVITDDEAENFFDNFFNILIDNPTEWRLFFQISMQNDVLSLMMKEMDSENMVKSQKLILDYFNTRGFDDPEMAVVMFSSVFKGFTLQYCMAPEMFSPELLERFKLKIKGMFLRKHNSDSNNKVDLDDSLKYFLM